MAEDQKNEPAEETSLQELRDRLADKQGELAQIRLDRQAEEAAQVERVQKAAIVREIERVEAEIEIEKGQLELQKQLNPEQVGAGVITETAPVEDQASQAPTEETTDVPAPPATPDTGEGA